MAFPGRFDPRLDREYPVGIDSEIRRSLDTLSRPPPAEPQGWLDRIDHGLEFELLNSSIPRKDHLR